MREPEAYWSDSLFELGAGIVTVCRFKSGNRVEAGLFLLDVFCRGVKDAHFRALTVDEFDHEFLVEYFGKDAPTRHPGACGRKLVEGAVRYALQLGLSPHADYKKGARVFGGINPDECPETFIYGHEGKPFYIQGSYDSDAEKDRVVKLLTSKLGPAGFTFLVADASDDEGDVSDAVLVAMDSHSAGGEPAADLVEFANEFKESAGDPFRGIAYPEIGVGEPENLAFQILEDSLARIAAAEPGSNAATNLESVLKLHQLIWNFAMLDDEALEIVLEGIEDGSAHMIRDAVNELSDNGSDKPDALFAKFKITTDPKTGDPRLLVLMQIEPEDVVDE